MSPIKKKRLLEELGIGPPRSLPNCGMVDEELLKNYLADPNQVSKDDQIFLIQCLRDFREWRDAAVRIIAENAGE